MLFVNVVVLVLVLLSIIIYYCWYWLGLFILLNIYNLPMFTFMFTLNMLLFFWLLFKLLLFAFLNYYLLYDMWWGLIFLLTLTELLLPLLNGRLTIMLLLLCFAIDWLFINNVYDTPRLPSIIICYCCCGVVHLFYFMLEDTLILSIFLFNPNADDKLFLLLSKFSYRNWSLLLLFSLYDALIILLLPC